MAKLKHPLSIFVVWHPKYSSGKSIANNIYSIFCRDIQQPLSRGLGIPVYYRSLCPNGLNMPIPIEVSNSTRSALVLLVDENYFIDEGFRLYTESLSAEVNDHVRIYPIALCKQSYELGCGTSSLQFIRAHREDLTGAEKVEYAMKQIKTSLLHDCARLLMRFQPTWKDEEKDRNNSPVKLFLSHAKKDGLETATRFKSFVDAELKLDVFFDTIDIEDGYAFEQQIEENIKRSALVVFHTDEYSAREWCRIEALIAKRNKCPIVVVHEIKKGEKRAFPYLGNTPTITLGEDEKNSYLEIVNLTLYQVLNNLFQVELLQSIYEQYHIDDVDLITIASPPELFNYIDIFKKQRKEDERIVVLYPEPPLGSEELKVLNEIDEKIIFLTPISLPTL
jgi:hypothetical protein